MYMETVQNKHWGKMGRPLALPSWASYLALGAYQNDLFIPVQRYVMAEYLTGSVDTYVESVDSIRLVTAAPEVEFSMTVAGENEEAAIENSLAAGLGAMASVGVRLESVELLALHLTNRGQLSADRQAVPAVRITDSCYDLSETANEVFPDELGFMADCQRLAGSALAD